MIKRDIGIELYRCLLMVGIVALHTFQCAGYGFSSFCRWIEFCVDGFVFISGWYGVQFGWKKVAKLFSLALFYSAIYSLLTPYSGGLGVIIKAAGNYWFVNAYVMLMCFAPIVNECMERLRGEDVGRVLAVVAPLLVAVFCWSFCCGVPGVREWIPYAHGFGSHSFLTMLGVYVAARLARMFELDKTVPTRFLWVLIGVLSVLAFLNLNKYNSPVAVLMGAACFLLMKRLTMGEGNISRIFEDIVLSVSPCMISVYLIHSCRSDFVIVKRLLAIWEGSLIGAILTVLIVFSGSVIIDLVRRLLMRTTRRYL